MHHVTEYCNVIGAHCTVRRDRACIHSSPDPSLSCGSGLGLRHYIPAEPFLLRFLLSEIPGPSTTKKSILKHRQE